MENDALAAGALPASKKAHRFAPPPRPSRLLLALRGLGSWLAGRRDGRHGIPDADDPNLPANVQRRVDQANAWMTGTLARRYYRERNRLQGTQQRIEGAVRGRSQTAPTEEPAPASALAPAARRPAESRSGKAVVHTQSAFVYVALLVGLFACEGILNKKAFELFSQTDTTLWLLVSGLAIGLILAAHLIGHSWRRSETERRAVPMLAVLVVAALAAAGVLGTMRYLSVDNQRQETIRVLSQQLASARSTDAGYASQLAGLERRAHLTPADRQSILILESRLAAGRAEIAGAGSELADAEHARGVDRAGISIPLFMLLNLFLLTVAAALSYHRYDPAAAEAAAARRHLRGRGLVDWARRTTASRRAHRARERRGRELTVHTRKVAELAAAGASIDEALLTLDSAYRAACVEAELRHEAVIRRYWTASNRQAVRRRRGGVGAWQRPRSQGSPLPFRRPPELA